MAARRRRSCSTDRSLGHNSPHGVARVLVASGDWECGRYAAGQGLPVVLAGECGGTAVPVLALGKVPAKREGWMGWTLEVGREVVVWCSGGQAAERSSVAHNRLVTVALMADGMVEVGTACVEERPWLNRVRCGVLERELLGVPPMKNVKSDGPAGGGIWSTGGVGMKLAYCHCAGSVLGCLLDREVAAVGGGAAVVVGVESLVAVGVAGVTSGWGVAKAGERTMEWSSVWAVACDVRRSVWVAADQGSGYGVVCCSYGDAESRWWYRFGWTGCGSEWEWSELRCAVGPPMLCRVMGGRLIGRPGRSSSAVGNLRS